MRSILFAVAVLSLLLVPGLLAAQEPNAVEAKALQLRPKSVSLQAPPVLQRAPFQGQPAEPDLGLVPPREDERLKASRSSCERAGQSLCYDASSGKIVYKKTREYMPDLPGMRAEHISLRRDRITFKYSFQ